MFANFEVCKTGLVQAEIKRRRHRTTTGCLECRRRKKKCDERLPICGGCLRGDPSNITCTRPQSPSPSQEVAFPAQSLNGIYQSPSTSSSFPSYWPSRRNQSPTIGGQPGVSYAAQQNLEQTNSRSFSYDVWSIGISTMMGPLRGLDSTLLTAFSSPHERRALQCLTTKFDCMTTSACTNPRFSILAQGLPLALEYPAVKSAFMACGLALLYRISFNPDEYQLSVKYYNKAINAIASHLMTLPEESNLSAVLLLHIFEEMLSDTVTPKGIHMTGAQSLVMSAFTQTPPSTTHQVLLLEAYIYHVVVSGIFSGITSAPLSDNHTSDLLQVLSKSSQQHFPGPLWRMSAIIGTSHEVFDLVFRISQLRRRLPLKGADVAEACRLEQLLSSPQSLLDLNSLQSADNDSPPVEMILTTQLYILACMLLIQKLRHLTLNASESLPSAIIKQATTLLMRIPKEETKRPMLTWPSLVLGCGAITPDEKATFCTPFEDCMRGNGLGSATQSYRFLKKAWEFDVLLGRELGLDILLRDDLLSAVFL